MRGVGVCEECPWGGVVSGGWGCGRRAMARCGVRGGGGRCFMCLSCEVTVGVRAEGIRELCMICCKKRRCHDRRGGEVRSMGGWWRAESVVGGEDVWRVLWFRAEERRDDMLFIWRSRVR